MKERYEGSGMLSIICVYNDEKQYFDMVDSINTDDYELVPVNNTAGRFSSASEALNFGAEKANGDVLIFCHQDILFGLESIKELTNPVILDLNEPLIVGSHGVGFIGKWGRLSENYE